jgi:uroporphyrinogen III methyltransferase/synthase
MGVGNLAGIAKNLMKHGRSPNTPAAVIQRGTSPAQRTLVGTLQDIGEKAKEGGVKPPAIIVVGDIVKLRNELNWFETMPLFGRRIVVTRAREQASDFLARLSGYGAECIEFPTIATVPPGDWSGFDRAIRSLDHYHWVLFTSVNGVENFFYRLDHLGRDIRDLKGIKVGAIGPKTASSIRRRGIRPDLVPSEYRAESMVEAFGKEGAERLRILLPRAALAREVLPEELKKLGASVDVVEAYQTIRPDTDRERVKDLLSKGEIHMITFTSSSTVNNFMEMFEQETDQVKEWMKRVAVACIGPITAKTAESKGLTVSLTPREYTIEGLTRAILSHFSK